MAAGPLDALARRHGVRLLLQHGSTVTGRTHAGSDLDLAVLLNHAPASADAYLALAALRDLRLYGFKRYQDHRRFLAMERDYVRRKVAESAG